jgi:hypothetical protein
MEMLQTNSLYEQDFNLWCEDTGKFLLLEVDEVTNLKITFCYGQSNRNFLCCGTTNYSGLKLFGKLSRNRKLWRLV